MTEETGVLPLRVALAEGGEGTIYVRVNIAPPGVAVTFLVTCSVLNMKDGWAEVRGAGNEEYRVACRQVPVDQSRRTGYAYEAVTVAQAVRSP